MSYLAKKKRKREGRILMNKNQRKNRPKKKEVPQEKWDEQLENIKRLYAYGDKKKEQKREGSDSGN